MLNKKMQHSKTKSAPSKKTALDVRDRIFMDDDDPIVPDDQLVLSPDELDEQYANVLYVKEPPKILNRIVYSVKNKKFVQKVDKVTLITLVNVKSSLLGYDSTEAEIQTTNELCRIPEVVEIKGDESIVEEMGEGEEETDFGNNAVYKNMTSEEVEEEFSFDEGEMVVELSTIDENNVMSTIHNTNVSEPEKESQVSEEVSEHSIISLPVKPYCAVVKLKNKFSFFDRITGTKSIDIRDVETQTTTTKRIEFRTFVSLSDIYDAYSEDFAIQEAKREKEMKKRMAAHASKKRTSDDIDSYGFTLDQQEVTLAIVSKTVEKLVCFNESRDIAQDFRYYEDQSDQFRNKGEGTLMMMWSMVYEKKNTLVVTDISWSPDYFDMFGITLCRPLNTIKSQPISPDIGYVCLWSLKNALYPYVINETHSGAICLSFHHNHGHIYVVGLRDGSLAVYNSSLLTETPLYKTEVNDAKHMGCVRQVVWREDMCSGELNFYSVSDDGTVCQWMLMQNEMIKIVKLFLTLDMYPELELGGVKTTYNAIGTRITFNPRNPETFLIGTIEGYIFVCNTEWSSYVRRFRAHYMKVNRIDYNKFDPNIYITCSEDYTVKLWDDRSDVPLMLINVKTSLSDVRWSPFSSTVFCVITEGCRAIFYDLDVSMKKPVCDQIVQSPDKYRLVRLDFDKRTPLIVIGSSKGTVITFKLSPNLRTTMKSPKKGIQVSSEMLEFEKLQTVLHDFREEIF